MNTRLRKRLPGQTRITDLTFGTWNVQTMLQPEPRDLEAYCSGGQGPPRTVAPSDDDVFT